MVRKAGRNGVATLRLHSRGFTLYWRIPRSPVGLSAEKMPALGDKVRALMRKFVSDLAKFSDKALAIQKEDPLVLLEVADKSLILKVDAEVRVSSLGSFNEEDLEAAQPMLKRLGYTVSFW